MTQKHYDIYVETVWNCASSKACSSVYLLDRAIGCCGMITTFTFGKEDGNQAEMLRTATLAALNRTLSESVESGSKVSLYINCGYVRNVLIQKRYQQWQNNGWETEQGRPVAEADLWKKLLALLGVMDKILFFYRRDEEKRQIILYRAATKTVA